MQKRVSYSIMGIVLAMILAVGCSGKPAPTSAPLTQADTPIPIETSLPTDTPPSTDTPEPSPTSTVNAVKPKPGTFSGLMENSKKGSNASVSGEASIKLNVSEDGAGITSAGYSIEAVKCTNPSGTTTITSGGMKTEMYAVEPSPIVDGNFVFISGKIKIEGQFTSPTEAYGTMQLSIEEREQTLPGQFGLGEPFICDFGTWDWSANFDPDVHFSPTLQPEEVQPMVPEAPLPDVKPAYIVTPGSQPPQKGVVIGSPMLFSGPGHAYGESLGIILKPGELVEILASAEGWTEVRWVDPEKNEVLGWILSDFVEVQK